MHGNCQTCMITVKHAWELSKTAFPNDTASRGSHFTTHRSCIEPSKYLNTINGGEVDMFMHLYLAHTHTHTCQYADGWRSPEACSWGAEYTCNWRGMRLPLQRCTCGNVWHVSKTLTHIQIDFILSCVALWTISICENLHQCPSRISASLRLY